MLKAKQGSTILALLFLAACAGTRQPIVINGVLRLSDEAPPPPGYVVALREWRHDSWLGRYMTIAVTEPDPDGRFTFNTFVCRQIDVNARFAGGVGAHRDDPVWSSPITIIADEQRTNAIRSSNWPLDSYETLASREAAVFQRRADERGGAARVPC